MDAVDRQEYPAMLDRLQPTAAVAKLNERVKRINKVNTEIADWLQERRKIEEQYAAGLRKLARKPLQDSEGDLGVFDAPWKKIVGSVEAIADSHHNLSERISKDVEQPLRQFGTQNREMQGMTTIQGNLAAMAKELTDAQNASEKLAKKGGKASATKVENASMKLQGAEQQWQSQAPFIFETLQAADERRLNHLRDVLTQYETHEADRVERNRVTVEQTLSALLEVDTAQEIKNWSAASVAGKPITERTARQISILSQALLSRCLRPLRGQHIQMRRATYLGRKAQVNIIEPKLKSRFGTMLQRRRQSIHGGFARAPSPSKGFSSLSRNSNSSSGRQIPSPQNSSNNLRDSPQPDNRLSALPESPLNRDTLQPNGSFNGNGYSASNALDMVRPATSNGVPSSAMRDLSDVEPPPGPPPSHFREAQKDSEGFSMPSAANDPISQAQQEAQELNEPQFKLDIRDQPIPEQDADAQAALSNVANTLRSSQLVTPGRKVGTVRGRRDVRHTVYVPSPSLDVAHLENKMPPSPNIPTGAARAAALAALSDHGAPSVSDTTSIRSGHSLSNHQVTKHTEMHKPGLNASIIETINATWENGEVKSIKIAGEVALTYISSIDGGSLPPSGTETIRINNTSKLEAIGPNRTFIHPVSEEKSDEFTVDLASVSHKAASAFQYRVNVDDSELSAHAPLLLRPAWKSQGDKLGLVLEYSLNPAFSSDPISFHQLIITAVYTGPKATSCQTKPSGTHVREKSRIHWRMGDVTLTHTPQKLVCRLLNAEGAVPQLGHIEARWEIQTPAVTSGIAIARLEAPKDAEEADPFADGSSAPTVGNWLEVETARKVCTGVYEAK
ncbi:SAFF domain-containing protein [Rutstroemia sp. NJR-2017a BBW]|nr:SAFF domain-containing protein [Rutstroemia sp. NJR-2017a BBW]